MGEQPLQLELANVGGIEHEELTVDAETVFIQGPNASNKSSFLKGLLFALGARTVPIRSGAEEARAILTIRDRRIERTAVRTDEGVVIDEEGLISDPEDVTLLERFAALLRTNQLRSAVAGNEPVESLLKEPMNVETLEARREDKLRRKRELSEVVEAAGDVCEKIAERDRQIQEKRERLEALEERRAELQERREDAATDDGVQELREQRASLRSDRSECESQISRLEAAIDRLEDRKAEIERDLEAAGETSEASDVGNLELERESIRETLEQTERRLDVLQSVLTANREMLNTDVGRTLGADSGLLEDEVTCWACGQSASTEDFEETVAELTDLVSAEKRRIREKEPEIEDLTERIEAIRESEVERQELQATRRDVEQQLAERRDSLSDRRDRLASIQERIDELDEEISDSHADQSSSESSVTDEIEDVRVEMQTIESEIERLRDARESLEDERDEITRKRAEIETLTDEITALTDRIENLESELREVFNGAMDDLIEALEFEHIERVWLDGEFDLVVAREIDGSVRTDALDHLAESEREMIGLVLGLAGYVTYDVDDISPVLVLDSLGAFDADRTHRLVEYFTDRTDYLVATAHPEFDGATDYETVAFDPPTIGNS